MSHRTSGSPDTLPLTGSEPATSVRWSIFLLACGVSFFLYLHRYAWNFIGPNLRDEYGLSETSVQTLYVCFSPSYGAGQVPSGVICDFFGPHLFLGIIVALWSCLLPLQGVTGNFYGLAAIRVLFGAAQSGGYPSLSKVTHTWFPASSRTIVQGWVATFFGRGGGAMSSIIMGTLLMGALGLSWRLALVVMGGLGLLFAAVFVWRFRDSPAEHPDVNEAERRLINDGKIPTDSSKRAVLPWGRAIKNRSMMFFVIQQAFSAGADMIYVSLMGQFFLKAKGFNIAEAGILVSLPLWGGAVGGIIGGYCNDALIARTGNRRWSRVAVGFTGKLLACGLMFVVVAQTSGVAAGSALFAVKFFSDWSQPTVWGTCTDLGGRYSGTVFGIINTSGTVGGFISPIVFGWILDVNTAQQVVKGTPTMVTDFNPLFLTVAAMYIVSAVCWFFVDCSKPLDSPAATDAEP